MSRGAAVDGAGAGARKQARTRRAGYRLAATWPRTGACTGCSEQAGGAQRGTVVYTGARARRKEGGEGG